jgi:hypothetical protein
LFGSRRFSQLSVSSFAQPTSFHSNGYRHTVVNELPLRSRIPNENSDEHGLGQEDGLATSRRDTALIAAICAAPAKGTPRKWSENCLKITENEVLHRSPIWDFLSAGRRACLRSIFTSRPDNRDRVSNSSLELECCGLVIHAARSGFFFLAVTNASVVSTRAEIEATFCNVYRVTFVGSTTPTFTRSTYSPVATS